MINRESYLIFYPFMANEPFYWTKKFIKDTNFSFVDFKGNKWINLTDENEKEYRFKEGTLLIKKNNYVKFFNMDQLYDHI